MVQRFIRGIIVPALAIAVWEAASRTGILKLEFLSRPSDILAAGIDGDQMIPLGRHGKPEEIARAVLFLASDHSASALMLDGGLCG